MNALDLGRNAFAEGDDLRFSQAKMCRELVAQGGRYATLFSLQAAGYR